MNTVSGPGAWPVNWDATPAAAKVPEGSRERLGRSAAILLWAATGRRFGLVTQTHTARPGTSAWPCSPSYGYGIPLPGPVHDIIQVVSGTTTFAAEDYRLRGSLLLRTRAHTPWPTAVTVVTYRRGLEVPHGGDVAAAVVAAELQAAAGGGKCRLPARATRVSREGVEVDVADPLDYLEAGLTGISEVDAWISTHNPHRLRRDSVAWSPDADPATSQYAPPILRPVDARRIVPLSRNSGW